jgi:bifunctional non-homologous end joining protein LigD
MLKSPFEPCIPTRGTKVPPGSDWLHEIKHDGYRLIVQRDGKRDRLFTRNGYDWSDRYPLITEAALRHLVRNRRRSRLARRGWHFGLRRLAQPQA